MQDGAAAGLIDSPFLKFAIGVHQGKYDNNRVFLDMVLAVVQLESREERGVGRQNFLYGPAIREFANTALSVSPELYRYLRPVIPLPDPRDLK